MTDHPRPNTGDVLLLVGTRKGVFIFSRRRTPRPLEDGRTVLARI